MPSPERTAGAGGLPGASPERASVQSKVTVTPVLFQPLALAAGVGDKLIVGGVLSILTTIVLVASTLPAKSVAEKLIVVMLSLLMVPAGELPWATVLAMFWAPLAL